MWQDASGVVLALSPFFFEVQLVIRKLLVLVAEVQWGCAGWEKLLCPACWSGSAKREVLSPPGGEGGYQMVSVSKPSEVYCALQSAFS